MNTLIIVSCVLRFAAASSPKVADTCVHGSYPPKSRQKVPEYIINLDLAPSQRWNAVAVEKKNEIKDIIGGFKSFIGEFGGIAQEIMYFIDLLGTMLDHIGNQGRSTSDLRDLQADLNPVFIDALPQPFQDEMRGISNVTGIEIGEITLYNIFYEIFTVCTSIIAESPTGKLYHARNLDFGLFMGWDVKNRTWAITEKLRPAIISLDWQQGGKTVFKSVNYAGYIGILTGISPGKFTLTMNERFKLDGGYVGIIDLILTGKGTWMGFLTRRVMEKAQSFNEARDMLMSVQMIAPAYFILGGNSSGEACVITRNREVNGTDVWMMSDPGAGGWYILETNYDHWEEPLFLDDRRTPANNCMRNMTQKGVGIAGLFDVLSSKPVLNKLTTYTALMQVNSGHLETWLQYCEDPCDPW